MNKKKTKEFTWAEIKAMFAENERRFAENERRFAENERRFDKSRAEADKRKAEADKREAEYNKRKAEYDKLHAEFGRRIDKVCSQVGGIDANIGHHAEQFFQDIFTETLTFGGERYKKIYKNFQSSDDTTGAEFDIVLVNGKSVAIIEVKNRIHPKFVKEMTVEKVAKFRRFFPEYKKHKAYLGIAGFSFSQAVRDEAQKLGVGIIKQVGNGVEIDAGHLKTY